MTRIAQLELEVAILKAMTTGLPPLENNPVLEKPDLSGQGYM